MHALQVRRANEGGGQQTGGEPKQQDAYAHLARVVKLSHAVTPEELADNDAYQEILEGECVWSLNVATAPAAGARADLWPDRAAARVVPQT